MPTPRAAVRRTTCCIVGAGPAGVVLAWLLARRGVEVRLLERHDDFERDFRGDTLHPGVLEMLDDMGLADQILALPHERLQTLEFHAPAGSIVVADLRRLRTKYPFVALLPQSRFLETLVADARRFPSFHLEMNADVRELLEEDGAIRGVRYVDRERGEVELRADLTVATDGRNSRLRRLAGLPAVSSSPAIDVLWFRLPRHDDRPAGGYLAAGGYLIALPRRHEWQIGYVIEKGRLAEVRAAGVDALRSAVAELAPPLAEAARSLVDWRQVKPLSVEADRLRRWYRPGLLCLGDAAHVMSPVGGVGVNYAIQDAAAAAERLAEPLLAGRVSTSDLRAVQRRRDWPTRIVQALQAFDQRRLIEPALAARAPYRLPLWLRLATSIPGLRRLPSYLFAFGVRRPRISRR